MPPTEELAQSRLEELVLEGVDERVDAAVGEDKDDADVVQRRAEVDGEAEVEGSVQHLVDRPADHEADDHRQLRHEQVPPDASHARFSLRRRAAGGQLGGCDGWPTQGAVHCRVAEDVDGGGQEEGEEERRQAVRRPGSARRYGRRQEAAPSVVQRRRAAEYDQEDEPGHRAGRARPRRRIPRSVHERMDDRQVALARDRDQVVGGGDDGAPQRIGAVPDAAEELVDEALQVALLRPARHDGDRHHDDGRE